MATLTKLAFHIRFCLQDEIFRSYFIRSKFKKIFKLPTLPSQKYCIARSFFESLEMSTCPSSYVKGVFESQVSKHVRLSIPFIEEATQKGSRKEHCMCIKEKQNISSQSFLRNLSLFYTPFRYL